MAEKYCRVEHPDDDRSDAIRIRNEAGRKCVRNLHQYPPLTLEWISLVESLVELSRLAQLEEHMPSNAKVADLHGRDGESGGTLWDQEKQENAIRILVEEAKVNLCVRMMEEYKKWFYDTAARQAQTRAVMASFDFTEAQMERKCLQFEESLGHLLMCAFHHIETLQLTDVPLLIEHIAFVLGKCKAVGCPEQPSPKVQEVLVLRYFSSLMRHAENLNNAEVLARVREFRLLPLMLDQIEKYHQTYSQDVLVSIAEGFSHMANNEDWAASWAEFFEDEAGRHDLPLKEAFLSLEATIVKPILEADINKRRDIRPLLDLFAKIRRSMR